MGAFTMRSLELLTCVLLLGNVALAQSPTYGVGRTPTAEEIREFCRPRMAPYKVPTEVEFIDEIPRSAAGKALRRLLRERETARG